MAITKIGPPLSGIRGTIGGVTYSANGSSTYAKAWSKGPNPRAAKQSTERTFLARMPALWAAINAGQRADWRSFASEPEQELFNSLGDGYFASGFNWFTKCNIRNLRVGNPIIDDAPEQTRPSPPTISAFRITPAGTDPNKAVGGVASASSFQPGFPSSNAFDAVPSSRWVTLNGQSTGTIQYVLTSSQIIRRYSITQDTISVSDPRDWPFERLDPGPVWTVLQTVTDAVFVAGVALDFYCANETAATTYRLNISANNGNPNFLEIFEIEFFNAQVDGSVIIWPNRNFNSSPPYAMVLHVAQGGSPALIVQYPGFLQTAVRPAEERNYVKFQSEIESNVGIVQEDRSWFCRLYRQTLEGLRSAAATASTVTR